MEASTDHDMLYLQAVRAALEVRRVRSHIMPAQWFNDPAWIILVDLFEAHLTCGDPISIESFKCGGRESARRWCEILGAGGMVGQTGANVELSASGVEVMYSCFAGTILQA